MKLAVSTYSLSRWQRQQHKSLEQSLQWIAGTGVRAVEFSGLDAKAEQVGHPRRAGQLRRKCGQLGLDIVGYCVGSNLLVAQRKQRRVIATLKQAVDTAAELGVPSIRHDVTGGWQQAAGVPGPRTFANALKVVVPAIREVADYAAEKGIKSTLENHGFYMQASARVENLIKAVKHHNYGLTIDMGNFLCVNDKPVEAVRRLARYVVLAHVKDFHVKPKRLLPPTGWFATPSTIGLRGAIVGHGEIDIPAQLAILKRSGYRGHLSLEFEGLESPTEAVELGLDFLRKQLTAIKALDN